MNHSYGRNLQMLQQQQQQQDSCFPQVMDANADFQQMLGDVRGDAGPGSYSGLREHGMGHGQQDVEAEQCFVSMASSNTCYPAHSQGGSPASPPSQACPWPQFQTSDVLMAGQHGQGYGDLNPLQQHRNGGPGSETAAMQGAIVSGLGPAMDQCSLSSDQAGLIANPSHMSVHHQRIAASREEMMCSEMGDWCGIAPQQQQHMLDSGMRYLPSVSMLAPGGNGASPGAGGGGGGMPMSVGGSGNPVARMLNMSQMANNNSSNANANANNNNNSNNNSDNSVVVPMSGGFPGSNLLQSPPGLLAGGGMLVQEGGGVMNPGGAFIPRHGHPLAASPSAHNSFQLFNPAAVSAAMDRVLNRTGSWMGQSMDGGQASMAHLQGACAGPGVRLATSHCLAQFSSDPGFAERAARFSSFTNASRAGPGGNPAMEVRPQQSRRASPVKSGQQNAGEGSRLWRTSSCPPLSTDHLQQPNPPPNAGQEGSKPAASEAATNSSGSNAPAGMETEQRSPSASTAAESQSQQGAGSEKRRTVPARNSSGKRLARTSSCPSTVVKLPLDAVVKVEEGSEQQKESSDGPEDSSSSDQDKEGSSDSQGKKRKSEDKISASSKNAADNGSRSPSTPAKSAKNEEAAVTNPKRSRGDKDTKSCGDSGDSTSPGPAKESNKPPELPKPDYIHVRARRGQATDSHSLAERVRREKISERMKYLQDLVPGCSKVTGKAVMLDEIINYVQSLQRQVEFLSLKLAAVNPRLEFNMDTIISKEMFQQQRNSLQHQPQQHHLLMGHDTMPMPSAYPTHLLHQQQHQHPMAMQMGATCAMDMRTMGAPYDALRKSMNAPMSPCLDNYGDTVSQTSTVWDNDLHNVVHHMGFGNLPMTSGGSC